MALSDFGEPASLGQSKAKTSAIFGFSRREPDSVWKAALMSNDKTGKWTIEAHPLHASHKNTAPVAPEAVARLIRSQFRLRDQRRSLIPHPGIDEIAWQILLDLYLGHVEGRMRFVSALCANTGASPSTSLRRLESLIDAGMAARQSDHDDQRRVPVVLTAKGLELAQTHIVNAYWEFAPLY